MKLFYSGAKTLGAPQFTPEKSLGGFLSSTVIPNGKVESVFSSFSNLSAQNGSVEVKGIFLQNTFSTVKTNVLVYCVYPPNPKVKIELAAITGNELEYLRSPQDLPYYADFYDVSVVYSSSIISINGSFKAGEEVKIEGVSIPVPSGTLEEFLVNVVKAFQNDLRYQAIIIDNQTIKLQYRILGSFINSPVVSSYYNSLAATVFGGGVDNSVLISKTLNLGDSIGIWLKRTPLGALTQHTPVYYTALYDKFVAANFGVVQQETIENINFCVEFT